MAAFIAGVIICLTNLARADEYLWEGGATGKFSDPTWYDVQTMQHNVGPPTPSDDASDESNSTITFNSGSVQTLLGNGGAGFDMEGNFSCTTLIAAGVTISGPATLTAGPVKVDGAPSIFYVQGGHLVGQSVTNTGPVVSSAGTLTVHTNVTGLISLTCSDVGSNVSVAGNMTDVNLLVENSGHVTASNITDSKSGASVSLQTGALLDVMTNLQINGNFFDVTGGATVNVGQNLVLDGKGSAS
ncbi:MAG: hypothetical protein ACRD5Z_01010, partial [Bryobacteraceae bacterium]